MSKKTWEGVWQRTVLLCKIADTAASRKIPVQLTITAQGKEWLWQIVYGADEKDARNYVLKVVDSAQGHWIIDEKNGIILDQFYSHNRLSAAFTVQGATYFSTYNSSQNLGQKKSRLQITDSLTLDL